jgi:hypothetical protein
LFKVNGDLQWLSLIGLSTNAVDQFEAKLLFIVEIGCLYLEIRRQEVIGGHRTDEEL